MGVKGSGAPGPFVYDGQEETHTVYVGAIGDNEGSYGGKDPHR